SLKMWAEYFPNGTIYGIDRAECNVPVPQNCRTAVANQEDLTSVWNAVVSMSGCGMFDLIIDDGSHQAEHQMSSLVVLWPLLDVGGLYVIEEVASETRQYLESYREEGMTITFHAPHIQPSPKGAKYPFQFVKGTEKMAVIHKLPLSIGTGFRQGLQQDLA